MEKKEIRRVKGEDLNCRKFAPTRPEGAEAPSPGQSPWVNQQSAIRPVRGKSFKNQLSFNILTLQMFLFRKNAYFCIHNSFHFMLMLSYN